MQCARMDDSARQCSRCLMSYGGSLEGLFRSAATYVDKIFKGHRVSCR